MRLGVICAVMLCACSSWIGLDKTELSHDTDGDGVVDLEDNCRNMANPDQIDADGDEVGDLCDDCISPHKDTDLDGVDDGCDLCAAGPDGQNEDGDTLADACDVCPEIADEDQADGDGDGVGDACEDKFVLVALDERLYFDGFAREPNYSWHPYRGSPAWPSSGGDMHALPPTPPAVSSAMELYAVRMFGTGNHDWLVRVSFDAPAAVSGARTGVRLFDDSFSSWGCFLVFESDMYQARAEVVHSDNAVDAFSAQLAAAPVGPVHLLASFTVDGFGGPTLECTIDETVTTQIVGDTFASFHGIRLETNSATNFHYIDATQRTQ